MRYRVAQQALIAMQKAAFKIQHKPMGPGKEALTMTVPSSRAKEFGAATRIPQGFHSDDRYVGGVECKDAIRFLLSSLVKNLTQPRLLVVVFFVPGVRMLVLFRIGRILVSIRSML